MIPELEAAAVVMSDRQQSRYAVEDAYGWAEEFVGREVALDEATWAAWVLRSAQGPYLLDNVSGHTRRMPVLVLDESAGRAASLLAVPLTARDRTIDEIRIGLIGQNLLLFTPYSGVDPASKLFNYANGSGLDLFNQPSTRSYSLQITIKL